MEWPPLPSTGWGPPSCVALSPPCDGQVVQGSCGCRTPAMALVPGGEHEQGRRDQVCARILPMWLFCRIWRKFDTNLRTLLLCEAVWGPCKPHRLTFKRKIKGRVVGALRVAEELWGTPKSSLSIMTGWGKR